jgi:methylated-DNA-[protein]-cysteine S-methyltransferase
MDQYIKIRTDLGTLALVFCERGISRIILPSSDFGEPTSNQLIDIKIATQAPRVIDQVARALKAHIAGQVQDFSDAPLDTRNAPPFLLRVQRAAQSIPAGHTRTYGELAALAGSPKAVRAVGQAMAKNPWPILVPCHRVFAHNGFGEYSAGGGVHTKLRLLWREGYRGRTSNVSFDEREAIAHLQAADPRLGKRIDRIGPFTMQATAPRARAGKKPFTALTKAIIAQQLSGKAAATIYARVAAVVGGHGIDDAESVLAMPKDNLRRAGLSESKTLSLLDLARHTIADTLPTRAAMESLSDEDIIEKLIHIRGIGRWSAQMLLIFYLGRPNVLPLADLGVQKGFALTYGSRGLPSAETIQRTARAWSPYASVASWYLWRVVEIAHYAEFQ